MSASAAISTGLSCWLLWGWIPCGFVNAAKGEIKKAKKNPIPEYLEIEGKNALALGDMHKVFEDDMSTLSPLLTALFENKKMSNNLRNAKRHLHKLKKYDPKHPAVAIDRLIE